MTDTDTITITVELAITLLREVVAEFGEDFVYEPPGGFLFCTYQAGDCPSCLVGQVLHRAGVTVHQLWQLDNDLLDPSLSSPWSVPWLVFERGAREVLQAAQTTQDTGHPWGLALRDAESVYETVVRDMWPYTGGVVSSG